MKIYQLTSENLQGLGEPMGSEYASINWVKPFETLEIAMAYAVNDYQGTEKIKWSKGTAGWHSQDLRWVMYYIHEVQLGGVKDIVPKMIADEKIDLSSLKKVVNEYMECVVSDKHHEDNDWEQFIYEETLKAFYGKDVFKFINKINS
jgi:hypothetical protein